MRGGVRDPRVGERGTTGPPPPAGGTRETGSPGRSCPGLRVSGAPGLSVTDSGSRGPVRTRRSRVRPGAYGRPRLLRRRWRHPSVSRSRSAAPHGSPGCAKPVRGTHDDGAVRQAGAVPRGADVAPLGALHSCRPSAFPDHPRRAGPVERPRRPGRGGRTPDRLSGRPFRRPLGAAGARRARCRSFCASNPKAAPAARPAHRLRSGEVRGEVSGKRATLSPSFRPVTTSPWPVEGLNKPHRQDKGGQRPGARSRSRAGCGSISRTMSPCASATRRSASRCSSRAGRAKARTGHVST